jgi:hypothetical protein
MRLLLPLSAAFLAGVLVAWAAARLIPRGTRTPEPASLASAEAVAVPGDPAPALLAALASLGARTERIQRLLESAPARQVAAGAPAADADEQLRLLRALERSLQELLARPTDAHAALQRLRAERPEPDWIALDALLAASESDSMAARRSVQLLSEAEVLRRYGSPGLTYVRDGVVRWVYGRDFVPEWDAYLLQLVLVFEGGLVRDFHVERTSRR